MQTIGIQQDPSPQHTHRSRNDTGWRRKHGAGFTLIEIMVVVIIIGILAALVVPAFFGRTEKAMRAVAKQKIGSIETAIGLFQQDYHRMPNNLEELTRRPSDIPVSEWNPPQLKAKDLIDPWGRPFVYRSPGQHWHFDLYSLGGDGREGGTGEDADIVNW